MTETRFLARFATIANAAFNSMSANSTAVTAMSIGGHTINSTSMSAATNTFTVGTAAYFVANGDFYIGSNSAQGSAGLQVFGAGTRASIGFIQTSTATSGGSISGIDSRGFDGSNYFAGGTINFRAAENWSNTNHGTDIQFRTTPTGSGGALAESMRITANGNVGIGTSSPAAQLHILNSSGNSESILGQFGAGTRAQIGAYANQVDIRAYNGTNDVMTFTTGASERMRITSTGNIGIGTSSPNFSGYGTTNLTVCGGTTIQGVLELVGTRTDGAGFAAGDVNFFADSNSANNKRIAQIQTVTDGATVNNRGGAIRFSTKVDNGSSINEHMRITANGNIGIGSATPGFPLTINRGGGAVMAFMDGGDLRFYTGGNGAWVDIYCDAGSELRIAGSIAIGDPGSASSYLSHGAWRGSLDRAWDNFPSISITNTTDRGPQGEFRIHGLPGVNGGDFSIVTRSDGGFVSGSDSRRKANIQAIVNPLDRVLAINGKQYQVINKEGEVEDELSYSGKKIGFIGQEIIEVLPEVVKFYPEADTPTESGWASAYSIDYGSVTALLVEAIKEQQTLIQSLTTRLSALENK